MFIAQMWKTWKRRSAAFTDRQPLHRKARQRPRLFLEPLEDRTLLTAWTSIGPAPLLDGQTAGLTPVSGRVTGLAADPNNAGIIYVATAGGGIWKTTTANTDNPTWTPLTDNLTDSSGNPLPMFMGAVAETDATSGQFSGNQIVYGGMGEANNSGNAFYGDGILVSTNGGTNWTLTTGPNNAFNGLTVAKIAIDPSDTTGGTAYAAVCDNGVNGNTGNTGIWMTTDFGKDWQNLTGNAGLSTTAEWTDVVVDPHTGNVYAAQGTYGGADGNGVYELVKGGTSWNLLNGQGSFNGKQDGRISLALYDDGTTFELFVFISQNTSDGGLYKLLESTDGSTFNDLTANVAAGSPGGQTNPTFTQGSYDMTLAVDPSNHNYVYIGGCMSNQGPTYSGSPLESFDGGSTWTDIAHDSQHHGPHSDDHAVAFDASGNLIDGNDGGVFRLNNLTNSSTQTWSDLNTNLQITQFYGIAVDSTNGDVWGGAQDNGTEKFSDNPASGDLSWTETPVEEGDGGYTQVDPTNHDIIYQEYQGVTPRVSTNGGKTFDTSISNGIAYNSSGGSPNVTSYCPLTLDSKGNVYFGTDYVNISSDHGKHWSAIGTPGTNNFNKVDDPILDIAVSTVNNNVVYVSTSSGGVYVTQNAQAGGNNVDWTRIDLPGAPEIGTVDANSIAVDPADSTGGTAYAVVSSFTGGGKHVYQTTDFGSHWTDISGNLLDTPVDSVAVSPDGTTVYVGTDVGVYSTSAVNGSSTVWTTLGTGLPNAQVTQIEDVPNLNLLAVGTFGRGAWEISTATAPVPTTNPSNQTVTAGQNATFTAAASGDPTPTVQWQVSTNGGSTWTNISGATSTTLTLNAVTAAMNGNEYEAVFSNSAGSATTNAAALTVDFAPVVTTNPTNQKVAAGQTAMFTAAADGNPTPTVQWQVSTNGGKTFTNLTGATSTTLTLNNVTPSMNGYDYQAVFTNNIGNPVITSDAILTVGFMPVVTINPTNQTVMAGQTATFTAAAVGNPIPTLQWQVSSDGGATWANISGATSTTLTLNNVTSSMNGYEYKAVFSNSGGNAVSGAAALSVQAAPSPTPPTLKVPPLLALIGGLIGGIEMVNANGTETVVYSMFGIALLTANYDASGNFVNATLLGFPIPNLFWSLV